jgi:hypothetical protein
MMTLISWPGSNPVSIQPYTCNLALTTLKLASLSTWAPELYSEYSTYVSQLESHHPELRRPFHSSVFPTLTINFGPQTVCEGHKDHGNLPFGLCAITPFGSFDPDKGGHIVLWELKLIVRAPPGSTILIPSAVITHGNTPIQRGEERYSFTQYTPGALFRWVDNGFQTQAERFGPGVEGAAAVTKRDAVAGYYKNGLQKLWYDE